jgi:hypothetical protein
MQRYVESLRQKHLDYVTKRIPWDIARGDPKGVLEELPFLHDSRLFWASKDATC